MQLLTHTTEWGAKLAAPHTAHTQPNGKLAKLKIVSASSNRDDSTTDSVRRSWGPTGDPPAPDNSFLSVFFVFSAFSGTRVINFGQVFGIDACFIDFEKGCQMVKSVQCSVRAFGEIVVYYSAFGYLILENVVAVAKKCYSDGSSSVSDPGSMPESSDSSMGAMTIGAWTSTSLCTELSSNSAASSW